MLHFSVRWTTSSGVCAEATYQDMVDALQWFETIATRADIVTAELVDNADNSIVTSYTAEPR